MCCTSNLGIQIFEAREEGAKRVIVQIVSAALVCTSGNSALQYSQQTKLMNILDSLNPKNILTTN